MRRFHLAPMGLLLALLAGCESPTSDLDPSIRALLSGPLTLQVGEVEAFQGESAARFGVDGGPVGSEYILVVSNLSTQGGASVSLTVQGDQISTAPAAIAAAGAEGMPSDPELELADMPVPEDHRFHQWLREQELKLVEELLGRLPGGGLDVLLEATSAQAALPQVGDLLELNVNALSPCEDPIFREARVEVVSRHAIVVRDLANPQVLSRADFEEIAQNFDEKVFPLATRNFGEPARQIGPPRTTIFYTTAVNELASDFGGLIGGFFFARDLFPRMARDGFQGCLGSNEREMFYLLTADPAGEHGQPIPSDFIRTRTLTTIVHEHQHLVNASRRLYILGTGNLEAVWLNEGLSHIAEELLFYQESGLSPRMNLDLQDVRASQRRLDAVNAFQVPNLARYTTYLLDPEAHTPIDPRDGLEVRGASWSFLRYVADQHVTDDADFFFRLVNTDQQGTANLRAELGRELLGPLARWSIANVADDRVPGLASIHRHPSWDFRSLLPALRDDGAFPLMEKRLEPGVPFAVTIRGGSAAFFRFAVAPGTQAALTVQASGGGAPPAAVRGSLVRTR